MPNYNYPYAPQYYPQMPTQPNVFPTNLNVGSTQPTQQAQQAQQIQDGGFITVPNEETVYSYPVAIGKCVTFKIEGKPIIMEKSMGFSQFDAPKIDKYRLVKEESEKSAETVDLSDMDKIKSDIREIWGKLDEIENSRKKNQPQPKADRNGEH